MRKIEWTLQVPNRLKIQIDNADRILRESGHWDLAAADLLVHEAGGLLTTLTGQSVVYNRPNPVHAALVAAGRARHQVLLGLIRDRLAEFA